MGSTKRKERMFKKGVLLLFVVCALVLPALTQGQRLETRGLQSPAVIAGGDVSIVYGISSETLPGIIEAATKDWRNLSDQQKQTIEDLQNKLGVNENALKAFFAVLGEKE